MHDDKPEAPRTLDRSYWQATRDWELMDLSLGAALGAVAAAHPDRCALVEVLPSGEPGRRWTYAGLYDWSRRTAEALLTRFAPGERIAVCADNVVEWMPLLYGAALGGFVLVTINPACRRREIRHVLEKNRARRRCSWCASTVTTRSWKRSRACCRSCRPCAKYI
ncbi:AMP-binding protein [Novosphingobium colocasiae]